MADCDKEVYDIGDEALLTAVFTDNNPESATYGDRVDPTTVAAYYKSPSGTAWVELTPVTNPSVGVYQATIPLNEHGRWYYRFVGTGENAGVQRDWLRVQQDII